MAEVNRESGTVNARILYWGVEGAGKSTNLRVIHQKLRPDHRGELQIRRTRLDPTVTYEVLPIELGDVGGQRTRIEVCTVPGAPDQVPTRKQLLDRVDGVVFVLDTQPERVDDNLACFDELRASLAAYGRSPEELPLVVQYNKCDLSDPYALEQLHKKLDLRGAAAFEAVASEGTAVLQTLTTISKRVMRVLKDANRAAVPARPGAPAAPRPAAPAPARSARPGSAAPARNLAEAVADEGRHPLAARAAETAAAASAVLEATPEMLQAAVAAHANEAVQIGEPLDRTASPLVLESVGQARQIGPLSIRLPVVLRDAHGGRHQLALTLSIGPGGAEGGS
jgi:signal recognition particle receptor subunit beta